ncbi:MAG: hypothetical protein H6553_00965 [Chitinophagales bacterium]|nr:hypothetical protein [Chitinophagales bacterium]
MKNNGQIDKVEYRYDDSSIPPEYHRSYIISVTSNKAQIVIDVYGDIILDTNFVIDTNQFTTLVTAAKQLERAKSRIRKNVDGASYKGIRLYYQDEVIYNLYWDKAKKMEPYTTQFAEQIQALIPNLKELLDTPYIEEHFN